MKNIKEAVRERYAKVARESKSCCDPISSNLYSDTEVGELPSAAVVASQGCGNPTMLAQLNPGETVLDLGSGGGIDVLLSARRVGPSGKAYGIDMTDEMLALARENQRQAGVTNVEFLKGDIEDIPLPDNSVDVVISNCVINLSPEKGEVLRETFRVLKPGGRFAVSDVIRRGELPQDIDSWTECVAGAIEEGEFRSLLAAAGFESIDFEITRDLGVIASAFIRARKPAVVGR